MPVSAFIRSAHGPDRPADRVPVPCLVEFSLLFTLAEFLGGFSFSLATACPVKGARIFRDSDGIHKISSLSCEARWLLCRKEQRGSTYTMCAQKSAAGPRLRPEGRTTAEGTKSSLRCQAPLCLSLCCPIKTRENLLPLMRSCENSYLFVYPARHACLALR